MPVLQQKLIITPNLVVARNRGPRFKAWMAKKVEQVTADMVAGKPEFNLRVQPATPVDKMSVAFAKELPSTVRILAANKKPFVNVNDARNHIQTNWRTDWAPRYWAATRDRVVAYLTEAGALKPLQDQRQGNQPTNVYQVLSQEKLDELAANPSPVIVESETEEKPKIEKRPPKKLKEGTVVPEQSATGTIYGYARVSTPAQSLDEQVSELKKMGAQQIYSEKFTGTTVDRPEFQKLLNIVQSGDTLIVAKLDRLGRNVKEALEVMDKLQAKGVTLRIGNIGTFETNKNGDLTPMAKMMRTMMLAFAEYERDMIVERTQGGKAYAKAHDPHFREGRKPVISGERLEQMLDYYKTHTVKETTRAFDVSKATLMRRVAENQAKTESD